MNNFLRFIKPYVIGLRAFTTQSFTEANVKNGLQFYARAAWGTSVNSNTPFTGSGETKSASNTKYFYLETGSKPIIVKDRVVKHFGEEFALRIYSNPTVTVNTDNDISVSNFRADYKAQPTTLDRVAVPDFSEVTDLGTIIGSEELFFGGSNSNHSDSSTFSENRERILPAYTSFLVEVQMTDGGGTGKLEYFLTWYEGETDL